MLFVPDLAKRALTRWFGRADADAESADANAPVDRPGLAGLLTDPAYELIPGAAAAQAVAALPPGSRVTVTCSPRSKVPGTLAMAAELAAAGHRVVPHLAARLVTAAMLDEIAATLTRHAITEVFVVAGDAPDALGPYGGTLDLLPALLDACPHVRHVGIAGYPDGHPLLPPLELRRQLLAKQQLLSERGLPGWVSTQMCFDPRLVRAWIEAERAAGLALPVHLGVPGVVDRARLVRIGARLGVGATLRFAAKQGGTIARLVAPGGYDPLHVTAALAPDAERLGIERLHVFTFNSVAETVAWREALLR